MANILEAIYRAATHPIVHIQAHYDGNNRANNVGDALEAYVKDLFANTFDETDNALIQLRYRALFSHLGSPNHPPDLIIRNGDAIEIKKIQGPRAPLALNSSHPKAQLYSDDPLINAECRNCEPGWDVKDFAYIIGYVSGENLRYLWIIYGDCFVANREVYERIKHTISEGVQEIPHVEFAETNELGRINNIDPLRRTNLRVRGMWTLENPHRIFAGLVDGGDGAQFKLYAMMRSEKFDSFPMEDKLNLLALRGENFVIEDKRIPDPNNPDQWIDVKLITYGVA